MDEKLNDLITQKKLFSWSELYQFYTDNFRITYDRYVPPEILNKNSIEDKRRPLWIFRGQENDVPLESSLRRYLKGFNIPVNKYKDKELGLIRKFRREYQNYQHFIPKENDLIQWLSIMQHYECPTRLLDFNYSFFIALHFAIKEIKEFKESDSFACIWAIDSRWLDKKVKHCSPSRNGVIRQLENNTPERISDFIIYKGQIRGIYPISPFELNDRLRVQQGLFLIPFSTNISFEDNLIEIIRNIDEQEIKKHIVKIKLYKNKDFIIDCLREVKRMGITESTLFPGLVGFAKSLRNLIPLEDEFLAPGE
ncbi:MAG: hypothetical protein A2Y33_06295 [Spirochaetes bacterium GWF1_51_8]|nr:MAG: hypothetical protein A2Y33_06295 [Spirochaetes bacterium GWF1_51_8]